MPASFRFNPFIPSMERPVIVSPSKNSAAIAAKDTAGSENSNAPPVGQIIGQLRAKLLRDQFGKEQQSIPVNASTQTVKFKRPDRLKPGMMHEKKGNISSKQEFEELVDELKAKYPVKSQDFDKVSNAILRYSKNSAIAFGTTMLSSFASKQLLQFLPSLQAFTPMLSKAIEHNMKGFFNGIASALANAELSEADSAKRVYADLRKESAKFVSKLPQKIQDKIATNDKNFERMAKYAHNDPSGLFILLNDRIRMMSVPQKSRDLGSPEIWNDCIETIEAKPEYVWRTLKTMLLQICENSRIDPKKAKVIRAQLYIAGPPGVGKTTLVDGLVKKGLKMEAIYINLEKVPPGKFTQYLAQKIIESGVNNPVVIIDEAGEHINISDKDRSTLYTPLLKKLLEPESSFLEAFGMEIDISKVSFFVMGNDELKNEALRSKMPQLTIGSLPKEGKKKAAENAVEHNLVRLRSLGVPEPEIQEILQEFHKHFDFILERDAAMTPGGRIIKHVVDKVFGAIRVDRKEGKPVVEKDIRDFIMQTFLNSIPPAALSQRTTAQGPPPAQPRAPGTTEAGVRMPRPANRHAPPPQGQVRAARPPAAPVRHPGIQVVGESRTAAAPAAVPAKIRTSDGSAQLTHVRTKVSVGVQTEETLPSFEVLHGLVTLADDMKQEEGPEEDLIEL